MVCGQTLVYEGFYGGGVFSTKPHEVSRKHPANLRETTLRSALVSVAFASNHSHFWSDREARQVKENWLGKHEKMYESGVDKRNSAGFWLRNVSKVTATEGRARLFILAVYGINNNNVFIVVNNFVLKFWSCGKGEFKFFFHFHLCFVYLLLLCIVNKWWIVRGDVFYIYMCVC